MVRHESTYSTVVQGSSNNAPARLVNSLNGPRAPLQTIGYYKMTLII